MPSALPGAAALVVLAALDLPGPSKAFALRLEVRGGENQAIAA
ncbi:hypothetical protein [Streptomyces decoyicus]